MKRILTILLVVLMVFSITSCEADARAKLAGYMGKMGQNVMGSDTTSAGQVLEKTEVKADEVKKPEVGGEAVKVTESVSVKAEKKDDGKVVTKVEIAGLKQQIEVEEEVKAVLPPMKEKAETIKNIGTAMKNDAAKDKLIQDMKKPVEDKDVQEAAKGTAVIMKSALKQVSDQVLTDTEKVPESVKTSLQSVSDSLEAITKAPEKITQADVVTLQLVNDFVETVAKNSEKMQQGEVPPEVLTDANNLFTVTSSLSPASKFNPNTLVGALVSGMSDQTKSKALSRAGELSQGTVIDGILIPADGQTYINIAYDAIKDVLGEDDYAATKTRLIHHKMGYENYANMIAGSVKLDFVNPDDENQTIEVRYNKDDPSLQSREFADFKSFAALTQYIVATAFSEGDEYYLAFKDVLSTGKLNGVAVEGLKPVDTSKWVDNVRDLIIELSRYNDWILNPTDKDVELIVPDDYSGLLEVDANLLGDIAMCLLSGRDMTDDTCPVVPGSKQYFRTAISTVNKMVVFTDLSSVSSLIGDNDLNYMLFDMDKHLYVEPLRESR